MKSRIVRAFSLLAVLSISVVVSMGAFADEDVASDEGDISTRVAAMFEGNEIFESIEALSMAVDEVTVSDDVFVDVGAAMFASLTGETFVTDYEKGAEELDFWNYEYGNSSNFEYQLLYNDDRAILRNITKTFSEGKALSVVDEDQILANAQADAETLGLTMGSGDVDVEVAYLTRTSFDEFNEGVTEYMAARVYVYRKIGGVPVRGARLLLGYYLDGTLQKVSMKWPRIEAQQLDMASLTATEEAELIEEAVTAMAAAPSIMYNMGTVHAEVAFEVRDGLLQRVLVFRPEGGKDVEGPLEEVVIDIP